MSNATDREHRRAMLTLNAVPGVGPVTLRRLLEAFRDDPRAILKAPARRLRAVDGVGEKLAHALHQGREGFDAERELERLEEAGARFVLAGEPGYPPLLTRLHDAPIGLYVKGDYTVSDRAVALVGTRAATRYGRAVAGEFAAALAGAGYCVVSGLARGIDAAAHTAALEAGGPTAAVLGCGINLVYPPESLELHERIAAAGVVISEFPLGRKADRTTFPIRNRLISGMCRAVVVIESDDGGGSLITARCAADQNRDVYAVPGRIDQPTSRGCHRLIREGATLAGSPADLLEDLEGAGLQIDLNLAPARELPEDLTGDERAVLETLSGGGIHAPDTIAETAGMPVSTVAAVLMLLEIKGLVAKQADGQFEALL